MDETGILIGLAPIFAPMRAMCKVRRWLKDESKVETAGNDRPLRSIASRGARGSTIDQRSIGLASDTRSIFMRSMVADPDRSEKNFFSHCRCDLLTREDPHAIDSIDMVARIVKHDHPNRCPTQFDPLFESKGKRSPFFFFSFQTQGAVLRAVTLCSSLR